MLRYAQCLSTGSPLAHVTPQKKLKREADEALGEGGRAPKKARSRRKPDEQSDAHRWRYAAREREKARLNTHPWSPRSRDVYYERLRPIRLVVFDEDKEVKLSFALTSGAYVGGHGHDCYATQGVSEAVLIERGLKKVPWDGRLVSCLPLILCKSLMHKQAYSPHSR